MDHPDANRPRALSRIASLLGVVVIAIVFAFFFFASSVCITLLLAAFLAILAEPAAAWLETYHLPRSASAALVVCTGVLLIAAAAYLSYAKIDQFVDDFPRYAVKIRSALKPITEKVQRVQQSANRLNPAPPKSSAPEVRVRNEPSWPPYLIRGLSSVWGALIVGGVVPFLTFFMLIRKDHIHKWLCEAYGDRIDVPDFVRRVSEMVRSFVIGNFIVAAISAAIMVLVLLALHVEGALMVGIASGIVNPIPYLGAIFAAAIPLLAATTQFSSAEPFVIIAVAAVTLHLITANLLLPKLVGSRVNVDPAVATLGILFWGWLWGAVGVLLAIPLTAFAKLLAGTQPSLIHVANLMAEKPRPLPWWARNGGATVSRAIPYLRGRFRSKSKS
jgi:predicted PurR-regulated permease PerM